MSIKHYNKLVRDKIPAIISKNGSTFETQILSDQEFIEKLNEKLTEEVEELLNATPDEVIGEIADILEVLYAIAETKRISIEEIETQSQDKKQIQFFQLQQQMQQETQVKQLSQKYQIKLHQ